MEREITFHKEGTAEKQPVKHNPSTYIHLLSTTANDDRLLQRDCMLQDDVPLPTPVVSPAQIVARC